LLAAAIALNVKLYSIRKRDVAEDQIDQKIEDETPVAKHHHKDKGTVVKTAFGETMSGGVADIADGDD
jgi:hypothetical protein